jgi:hypothetical protein
MAWSEIKKGAIGEGQPCVKVGATRRSQPAHYGQMVIHLSASISSFIRVRPGERVCLEVGTLADEGWVRIAKGDDHLASGHGHEGSLRVRVSSRRFGVTGHHKPVVVKHRLVTSGGDHWVVFMLPQWAREGDNGGARDQDSKQG